MIEVTVTIKVTESPNHVTVSIEETAVVVGLVADNYDAILNLLGDLWDEAHETTVYALQDVRDQLTLPREETPKS